MGEGVFTSGKPWRQYVPFLPLNIISINRKSHLFIIVSFYQSFYLSFILMGDTSLSLRKLKKTMEVRATTWRPWCAGVDTSKHVKNFKTWKIFNTKIISNMNLHYFIYIISIFYKFSIIFMLSIFSILQIIQKFPEHLSVEVWDKFRCWGRSRVARTFLIFFLRMISRNPDRFRLWYL